MKSIDLVDTFGPHFPVLELAHIGVEVVGLTRVGDILGALAAEDLFAAARDGERLFSNAHGEVGNVYSGISIDGDGCRISTCDSQLRRLCEQSADKNKIMHQLGSSRNAQ